MILHREGLEFISEVIGSIGVPQSHNSFYVNDDIGEYVRFEEIEEVFIDTENKRNHRIHEETIFHQRYRETYNIYEKCKEVFSEQTGKIKNIQCHLKIKENVAFKKKSYPIPQVLKAQIRTEINKMMNQGIINKSHSPFTNPLQAIPKKDGKIRLCLPR